MVFGVIVLLIAFSLFATAALRAVRAHRRAEAVHDDSLRAGPGEAETAAQAALRAAGLSAWMRAGGGGGA